MQGTTKILTQTHALNFVNKHRKEDFKMKNWLLQFQAGTCVNANEAQGHP